MATIDLSQLPAPDLVDEYTDEDMTTIAALAIWLEFPGSGIPQPGDPLYAAAVMIAKRVNALRSRINEGARSVFLSSATGGSIDQLGALDHVLDAFGAQPVADFELDARKGGCLHRVLADHAAAGEDDLHAAADQAHHRAQAELRLGG